MVRNILVNALTTVVISFLVILMIWCLNDFRFYSFVPRTNLLAESDFFVKKENITEYISLFTGFYSTIIALLIALVAIVSTLAFLVVKTSAVDEAQREAAKQTPLFFGSAEGTALLAKSVDQAFDKKSSEIVDALRQLISQLEEEKEMNLTRVSNILDGKNETAS